MERKNWLIWAERLHHWKLKRITAAILDAFGPLNIIGAQLMYLSQPLLHTFFTSESTSELAHMLEDPEKTQLFILTLRTYEPTPPRGGSSR